MGPKELDTRSAEEYSERVSLLAGEVFAIMTRTTDKVEVDYPWAIILEEKEKPVLESDTTMGEAAYS